MDMQPQTSSGLRTMYGSFREIPENHGAFAVMGLEGDTKHIWDKSKPAEVEAARALFNTLVKEKKYLAFRVQDSNGEKGGDPVKEFDPNEERYIFTPPMQGG